MKYTAALRVTGEICFYFSILSLFAAFRPWLIPMAAFAAACLAVALIAVRLRSAPVRALLALLPGVCFLFTPWSLLLIFPGLAWLYFIAYLGLGRFGIALYDYRGAFRWMLIISAFVLAGQAINSMLFHGAAISYVSLAFLGVFVLLSVAALRGMQMGAPMDRRWHAANVLTVAGSLIAAVGISLGLYLLYRHSVPLIFVLLSPLKRFLAWLFGLIRFEAVTDDPTYHPGRCAALWVGGKRIGVLGQIHPLAARNYGMDCEVYCAELNFTELLTVLAPEKTFKALPRFPATSRDLAVVCPENVTVGALEETIRQAAGKLLREIKLFDVYRGAGIESGKKSAAFSLSFRAEDRTLTDADVEPAMNSVLEALEAEHKAIRR